MTHHGEGQVQQFFQGLAVLLVTLLCPWQPARAQGTDPNTALANELIVVIDAPSDQQPHFFPAFRETPRYGEDVKGVLDAVEKKFGALDWTFAGHSEGSISAAHAARSFLPARSASS